MVKDCFLEPLSHCSEMDGILAGCKREDRRAQKNLYAHFYPLALKVSLRFSSNYEDALIIVNEGFYKVFSNFNKYDFKRPFFVWLTTIIKNTAIDYYRSHNQQANNFVRMDDQIELTDGREMIHSSLNYQDLLSMIESLSPAYRKVFILYAIEGYSHDEIAEMLGIAIGTSKSNLFKAKSKLCLMLSENQP